MGGTKFGSSFLMDSTNLGKYNTTTDQAVQRIDNMSNAVGQNSIAWENSSTIKYVYQWGSGNYILQWRYDTTLGKFTTTTAPYKQGTATSGGNGGGSLIATSNGQSGGILWAMANNNVFYALDATDVSKTALWSSATNSSRDGLPQVGKWQFPVVVNGKAYVPTGGTSLVVYGLLPVTVAGTLNLQAAPTTAPAQNFTFQFRPTDGGATITKTVSVSGNGAFSIPAIPANKYILRVKGGFYLAATAPLDATNGPVSNANIALDPGDSNGDNSVDATDFGTFVGAYNSLASVPGSGYDATADFNYDGSVDATDFGLFVGVYGATGAN